MAIDENQSKRPLRFAAPRACAVDLFAGVGGMTLGFERAGFDVLASVEIDPIHCAAHKYNFPFWSIICRDVSTITGAEIRSQSAIGDRPIDVVFGGPPCQGFSLIGKRILDDPRNALVYHFIRLVLELNPKYFVMENVKGMTTGKHRHFIEEIISLFRASGYRIQEDYKVLNAAAYGVPQNRERLFLMGCRIDLDLPSYPQPITQVGRLDTSKPSRKKSPSETLPPGPTVWEAIADLPVIENYPQLQTTDSVAAVFKQGSNYANRLRGITTENDDYSYERVYDPCVLTSSMRSQHTLESTKRFQSTPPGTSEPISRFHRLDPQGICNTLRAGTPTNRGAFTAPRPIHPVIPRCITVREAARLHSYPDWFRFHTTKWHGFRQIGNSVPPLLAAAVASEIIKALKVEPVKPALKLELGDRHLLYFDMTEAAQYFGANRHVIEPRTRKSKVKKLEKLQESELDE